MSSRSTFKYPFPVSLLAKRERMHSLVEKYWKLNRTAVNPDTDKLVDYLRKEMEANVLEVKSGDECLTWRIPKHWVVRKGQLRKKDGTIIADFEWNPLYLWTHSISFVGEISHKELIANHVYTDPDRPEEIPYHYRNGYRYDAKEWGFSLPYKVVEQMNDSIYEVEIDTVLDNEGTLKVVDAFLPGEKKETIFFMAHTCHPALVSDGIACIAVAVELFHYLKTLEKRRYSYRFLFGPEYFAAAAYLANAKKSAIESLKFGVYLDMLSNHEPLGFQYSMQGDSYIDKVVRNVFKSHVEFFVECPYRQLWGNDEMFYNGPGFLIPTIGIARGMHREYHYDSDNIDNMDLYHMVESLWILMRIVEVFETDFVPVVRYKGPLYLSRYNLYVDPTIDQKGARNLEKMQSMADGNYSCLEIADILEVDYFKVRHFFNKLIEKGLAEKIKI